MQEEKEQNQEKGDSQRRGQYTFTLGDSVGSTILARVPGGTMKKQRKEEAGQRKR